MTQPKPPPPPPPPRLGVSRSYGSQFPIANGQTPVTPPNLPPKPRPPSVPIASNDHRQQRQAPPPSIAQGRPAHIHTNGSITGLSPPHYQQKSTVFAYQHAPHCVQSIATAPNGKHAEKPVTAHRTVGKMEEQHQKLNLDVMERLTQYGGDPLTDEHLVKNLEMEFRKGICWVSKTSTESIRS